MALELGQVSDPHARRALEQLSLPAPLQVPVVNALPVGGRNGQIVFLTGDLKLHVFYSGSWR